MSSEVVLSLRAPLESVIEAECIAPDRFATMGEREIAALPMWDGRFSKQLGDFFAVRGERADQVLIEGDVRRVEGIGSAMAGGELRIEWDVGSQLGAGMSGGLIDVRGSAGDGAGSGMSGGTIRIHGNAGKRAGGAPPWASRGMTGGEVIVFGSVGAEAGVAARRGLVVIGGDAGEDTGVSMIAGTVVAMGTVARGAGRGSKRGTIVALDALEVPVTYRYACTYSPPFIRLLLTYLRTRHGLEIEDHHISGRYRRYSGDMAEIGKGEILQFVAE